MQYRAARHKLTYNTASDPTANEELVAKLSSEIAIEEGSDGADSKANEALNYLKEKWDVQDVAGSQEIKLTRKHNDETIEVTFSVGDSASIDQQPGMEGEDDAYLDEEFDEPESAQSGGANTKGAINTGRTRDGNVRVAPEDRVAPADRPELADEEGFEDAEQQRPAPFPVQLSIKITKDGKPGALEIDAEASDGYLDIQNVSYWPSADVVNNTAEAQLKKVTLYGGPSYHTLDTDLQGLMDDFLEERGIDTELSLRLPDIVDWKEQKEYMNWLYGELNTAWSISLRRSTANICGQT